jgi:magnesium transporter
MTNVPDREPGLLAARAYSGGLRVADIALDTAGEWVAKADHVVWIGLLDPLGDELSTLQAQLGLNPLAMEDASRVHQRPKMKRYGDNLFIVVRTAEMMEERVTFGETHIFAGRNYVVTVRHGASAAYRKIRAQCEAAPALLAKGPPFIIHTFLDLTVDHYLDVLDMFQVEGDAIEGEVMAKELEPDQVKRLYILRRELLRMKNGMASLVEVCGRIEHSEVLQIDKSLEHCFREIIDHVRCTQEEIDSLRERLGLAFDASLLTSRTRQTEISRRLAAWAAILAVPTATAGIYGMNFADMPELQWRYGYPVVLAFVALTCAVLYLNFRRAKWL